MHVREAVKRIQLLPEASVDCSVRQGRDAVLKQLTARDGSIAETIVDAFIEEDIRGEIALLVQKAAPYDIPGEYIFFLEFYGGLAIDNDDPNYNFSVLGIGPMVEEWYGFIAGDEALQEPGKYGFLSLGSLNFGQGKLKSKHIGFFLDLAGGVQEHCVIGVGPWGEDTLTPSTIIKDLHAYPDMWRKIAGSFTEWLEQAAETRGAFGYT